MTGISKYYRSAQILIIIASAIMLYANTFNYNYALDDAIVITENIYTKKGINGLRDIFTNDSFTGFFKEKKELVPGGRYRPLSIATFAIEYELFGEKPGISHIINVILYAITGLLILTLFSRLYNHDSRKNIFISLPFVCALLFVFHPLHTEVVANIKGRDEILALLFSLGTLSLAAVYNHSGKVACLVSSALTFFMALLSKENAIIYILLIPLTVWYFTESPFKRIFLTTIPLLIAAVVFIIIRTAIIGSFNTEISGELMNNPFLHASLSEKYATIFFTLLYYIKLLFIPHPLTYDYYPYHIRLHQFGSPLVIISVILHLLIIIIAFAGIKNKSKLSYSILIYLLPLIMVSNIIFNVGTFMNERFIYLSSLGFCMLAAFYLTDKLSAILRGKIYQLVLLTILVPVLTLYSVRTISRNKAWKNDFTLFTTDVKTSSNSAKSNCTAGGIILEKAKECEDQDTRNKYLTRSIFYLNRAVKIHPDYIDAYRLLGNAWYDLCKDADKAIYYYIQALKRNPADETTYRNIHSVLNSCDSIDQKISLYKNVLEINPARFDINYRLGNLYGKYKNDIANALYYLNAAAAINKKNKELCKDLGVAYGMDGQYVESVKWLEKAVAMDPGDYTIYINLGITYRKMGNQGKAKEYFLKAEQLK
jgi:tetratricopeptide (TPR) repeat protein